ncbi:MAG: TolB family protein [Fimbriimonas sp.]
MACPIGCLLYIGLALRGCMTEHSRSAVQGDITFDISPDGQTLVFAGFGEGRRDLYLFDVASRAVTRLTSSDAYETCPTFSRDGKRLAFTRGTPGVRADQLCVMDLKTRKVVQLTDADENVSSPVFLPDGKRILCTVETQYRWGGLASNWNEGGELRTVDIETQKQTPLKIPSALVYRPRVSANGKWISWTQFGAPAEGVYVAPLIDPPKAARVSEASDQDLNSEGTELAIVVGTYWPNGKIYLVDRKGRNRRVISGVSEGCSNPIFSPDGKYVYFLAIGALRGPSDTPTQSLMRVSTSGGEVSELASHRVLANPGGP